jgi:CRP-like cAMP-binding protein
MKIKQEQFECGYAIYQVRDGSFKVFRLTEKGNKILVEEDLEFYANAVCALIGDLTNEREG